jgi:hypothetical protein
MLTSSISTAAAILTSLHFNKCSLRFGTKSRALAKAAHGDLLSALASLTALQELSMVGVAGARAPVLLTATVLQPLQRRTQLQLQTQPQADVLVQHD